MIGLYVYAITDRPVRLRGRGIFRRPLRTLRAGGLYAVVEPAARPPATSLPKLRAQGRVIARLVRAGADILPARFGAHVKNVAELERALGERTRELARALRRVRGCVQMTVRVARPRAAGTRADRTSGTRFLRAQVAAVAARRRDRVMLALRRAARPYARATVIEWREEGASVFHLVPRARVAGYTEALAGAVKRLGAHAVISGPWAPFAFVKIE